MSAAAAVKQFGELAGWHSKHVHRFLGADPALRVFMSRQKEDAAPSGDMVCIEAKNAEKAKKPCPGVLTVLASYLGGHYQCTDSYARRMAARLLEVYNNGKCAKCARHPTMCGSPAAL